MSIATASPRLSPPWPLLLVGTAFVVLVIGLQGAEPVFHWWFPELDRPMYTRATFLELTLSHAGLVAVSSLIVVVTGIAIGTFVTRPAGREFRGVVDTVTAVGQTLPPSAVLAICVPIAGYGAVPTLIALSLYGLLPVVDSTIAGLGSVSEAVKDSADGLGLTPLGRLAQVELPLAAPIILTGVRTSVVINIGTATIGSTVGALTLGSPIIEGLAGSNPAYVLQGAIVVGLFAILVDLAFERLDRRLQRRLPPQG